MGAGIATARLPKLPRRPGAAIPHQKKMTAASSKAFRATFPRWLPEHQIDNIRRWADRHLAASTIFRDDGHRIVLLGLDSKARTAASFSRTLRTTALKRMGIETPSGHWVTLVSSLEVLRAVCSDPPRSRDAREERLPPGDRAAVVDAEGDAVRVIHLV